MPGLGSRELRTEETPMVIVDYILLGAFVVSVGIGFFRGFFKEAMSLITWVLALWVAWRF